MEREFVYWQDFIEVRQALNDMVSKLQRVGGKSIYAYLDVATAMEDILEGDHQAYIVDGYFVLYGIGTPWYAKPGTTILYEKLVLALAVSGEFNSVPAFLERKAREAGCQLVMAGTALARSDAALASLYHRNGFLTEGMTLTKEI